MKTKAGTELPIMQVKGKDYLQVQYRIVWFREEHPDWTIETEFVEREPTFCLSRAVIRNESGRVIQVAHKYEDKQGFADFIEKSETGAIGRALANIGYGTQFCGDELDEGERIVDSPRGSGGGSGSYVSVSGKGPVIVPKSSGAGSAGSANAGAATHPSKADLAHLFNVAVKAGWTTDQVGEAMRFAYGVKTSAELTLADYQDLLETVQKSTFEHAMSLLSFP